MQRNFNFPPLSLPLFCFAAPLKRNRTKCILYRRGKRANGSLAKKNRPLNLSWRKNTSLEITLFFRKCFLLQHRWTSKNRTKIIMLANHLKHLTNFRHETSEIYSWFFRVQSRRKLETVELWMWSSQGYYKQYREHINFHL